jgi:geranylgeranyl reductase family protein
MQNNAQEYDVVIIGAGPAGCACALTLKDRGLKVALIDKHSFPRDKVCGDAIPGRAVRVLERINPEYAAALKQFPHKCDTKQARLFFKGSTLAFQWKLEAYTCARMAFDNFLFSLVKEDTGTKIFTGIQPVAINTSPSDISLTTSDHKTFTAKLLIGADGAHSFIAKQLTNKAVDRKHHVGSVRAYYSDVAGVNSDTVEVYFDKRFLPSYLWVFPVSENKVNVGFGMLSSEIAKRRVNIKDAFYEFIDRNPVLSKNFNGAKQVSELEGFGLPLGSKMATMSGANFMLAGDAASLIDPISGDGIGNAMLSGHLAAKQAIRCFEQGNFGATFMKDYDSSVHSAIGKELKSHYNAQRTLSRLPFLLDVIFLAGKNKMLKKLIQKGM